MTLYAIIDKLKMLALKHPNVNSAYEGNIYDIMNANPEQKYASVVLTQQSHTQDDTYDHYGFNLFYVDRLVDNMDDNRVQIQSTGKSMLSNIIKAFCEEFDAECENINYQTFTERFADECAGVYCTITIDMVKDIYCTEKYWDESWEAPMVTVRNQNKTVQFTENGTYIIDYDAENYTGLGKVSVEVNVPDLNGSYDEGYTEGKTDGINEQKSKLESISITENGTYTKEDGYNEIIVEVPDLNGSYDEGYNQGKNDGYVDGKADGIEEGYSQGKTEGYNEGKTDGYSDGKTDGISEQKAKLESITITENGTYTREDGYNNIVVEIEDTNGSYDDGFSDGYDEGIEEGTSNAGAIIAETSQVLNITENGVYSTKYSKYEDIGLSEITGYYDDGTPFYEYTQLENSIYKTDITLQPDSVVEIWWKPDFNWEYDYINAYCGIFSTLVTGSDFTVYCNKDKIYTAEVGNRLHSYLSFNLEDKWYHIKLSDAGLVIDGETITRDFGGSYVQDKYLYINAYKDLNRISSANGYYGMIKITSNGVVYTIIPTKNGFTNITTNTPLEEYRYGKYRYRGLSETDGNLIRTVDVNIPFKVNMEETGLKLTYGTFEEVPEWVDWTRIKDMGHMFDSCNNLTTISSIDTSNVTNMGNMFYGCNKLVSIPQLDTSNVTDMGYMFYTCSSLTTIPQLDTSNVTKMNRMFYSCSKLVSIPPLNAGKVTNIDSFFSSSVSAITDFGGLIGLKVKWNDNYGLVRLPNLTYESCINVLNGLYDFTGNGETPTSSQGILKVHANFLTTVGDELSIGTNKGWTITA